MTTIYEVHSEDCIKSFTAECRKFFSSLEKARHAFINATAAFEAMDERASLIGIDIKESENSFSAIVDADNYYIVEIEEHELL